MRNFDLKTYKNEDLRWGLSRCISDETRKEIEEEIERREKIKRGNLNG